MNADFFGKIDKSDKSYNKLEVYFYLKEMEYIFFKQHYALKKYFSYIQHKPVLAGH